MAKSKARKRDEMLSKAAADVLTAEDIGELTLLDNIFMGTAFDDQIPLTQTTLRIIMRKPDLEVISVKTETSFVNIGTRSIRIDVFAKDSKGRYYNIEVQKAPDGVSIRRIRFHASLITAKLLRAGQEFDETPDLVVIFICESDIFKAGRPYYEFGRCDLETGERFDDGEQIVVVNGEIQDETPLGMLMHDFHCKHASDAKIKEVRERLSYMKDSKEGQDKMSDVFERWYEKRMRAREEERVRVMVRRGRDAEEIAEVFPEFTLDEIRAIEEQELAVV